MATQTVKMIAVPEDKYKELMCKAEAYEKIRAGHSKAGKASVAKLTRQELSARAKKAVEARIRKYGQKSHK